MGKFSLARLVVCGRYERLQHWQWTLRQERQDGAEQLVVEQPGSGRQAEQPPAPEED